MNEQDRERYIKLILLSDNLMAIKKYEKKLEIEYQNMVDEMMPEIWENFANDVKWETHENFHKGCDICQGHTVEDVREALMIDLKLMMVNVPSKR